MRQIDAKEWDPTVRRLLKEMGFFELLRTDYPTEEPTISDDRYVKFRRGPLVDGSVIDELRELHLDPHVSVPNKRLLFSAVTEAMTNVRQHAYRKHAPYSFEPQFWWLSAAFNTEEQMINIMIYDRGSGIPETLRRTWPEKFKMLAPATTHD